MRHLRVGARVTAGVTDAHIKKAAVISFHHGPFSLLSFNADRRLPNTECSVMFGRTFLALTKPGISLTFVLLINLLAIIHSIRRLNREPA